jgi:hypothetical protein
VRLAPYLLVPRVILGRVHIGNQNVGLVGELEGERAVLGCELRRIEWGRGKDGDNNGINQATRTGM